MASPARSPRNSLSRPSSHASPIQEFQESFQDTLRHWKTRVRTLSMGSTSTGHGSIADLTVKMGSSIGAIGGGEHTSRIAYHRSQPSDSVTTLLVNMGNSTALFANAGFRPQSNGQHEQSGVEIFMRRLGLFLAQDEDDCKSLSFCEDSEVSALQCPCSTESKLMHCYLVAASRQRTRQESSSHSKGRRLGPNSL